MRARATRKGNAVLASPAASPAASPPVVPDRWQAWDNHLETTPHTGFMQSSWWADFRTAAGYEYFGAILKDGAAIVGGALVQKFIHASGSCFYYVQDGPLLPDEEPAAGDVFTAILHVIEEHRRAEPRPVSHLRLEPRWPRQPECALGFSPVRRDCFAEPRHTLWVDLRQSEAALLAQMKPKGRYNIRVAQRHGVTIVEDNSARGRHDFQAIYADTAGRQGFAAMPPDYFQTLIPLLVSRHRGSLFFAEHQGVRLAAALVVYFGPRATYFFGGSLGDHREVMAPYLLHFEIMRQAKARGHAWYDFWGVAPDNEPDDAWHNLSVFKRKFGGVEVRLTPTLDLVYDADAYAGYRARTG